MTAAKRDAALALGAVAAYDSGEDWPVPGGRRGGERRPGHLGASIRALAGRRPAGRLRRHVRARRSSSTCPRLFFKQIEVIGSTMGGYGEFAEVTRLVEQGLPVSVDSTLDLESYPTALARLEAGAQLGKVVLTHR